MKRCNILIRCDASWTLGYGHLVRCLAIAEELRDDHHCRVTFAMRGDAAAIERVAALGFAVRSPCRDTRFNYDVWFAELVTDIKPQAVVLDVRDNLSLSSVQVLRSWGICIVVIDDAHERRLAADLVFYPPVPQLASLDWQGFTGAVHSGWEWLLLRRQFASLPPCGNNTPPRVLITMGGSDPDGLTARVVAALGECREDFTATVVIGPGFKSHGLIDCSDRMGRPYELVSNVSDMATLMVKSDLAIATFGVTAYELAAAGTPALLLCLNADHVTSSRALVEAGIAISLGHHADVASGQITESIENLLADRDRRHLMASRGQASIDGYGSRRVAGAIMAELERRTQ
jgi:spore coat polysaccharide biosynthesis protein SpsF